MFRFLLGVLILASNFLGVSRAVAETDAGSVDQGVVAATVAPTPLCQQATTKLIRTLQDLRDVHTNLSRNYCLANDIDASPTPFTPIGSDSNPFIGVFEGNGHFIDKLTISSSTAGVGLFGHIGMVGRVQNINLTNASITGAGGGALAVINDGTVSGSSVSGAVQGTGTSSAVRRYGGLVGINRGSITNSFSNAPMVVPRGLFSSVGGLVGFNDTQGTISNSYTTGAVTCFERVQYGGGLVGSNRGTVVRSFATGMVKSFSFAGGLVGANSGPISQSYATGAVIGRGSSNLVPSSAVGGLVGSGGATNFSVICDWCRICG